MSHITRLREDQISSSIGYLGACLPLWAYGAAQVSLQGWGGVLLAWASPSLNKSFVSLLLRI